MNSPSTPPGFCYAHILYVCRICFFLNIYHLIQWFEFQSGKGRLHGSSLTDDQSHQLPFLTLPWWAAVRGKGEQGLGMICWVPKKKKKARNIANQWIIHGHGLNGASWQSNGRAFMIVDKVSLLFATLTFPSAHSCKMSSPQPPVDMGSSKRTAMELLT